MYDTPGKPLSVQGMLPRLVKVSVANVLPAPPPAEASVTANSAVPQLVLTSADGAFELADGVGAAALGEAVTGVGTGVLDGVTSTVGTGLALAAVGRDGLAVHAVNANSPAAAKAAGTAGRNVMARKRGSGMKPP